MEPQEKKQNVWKRAGRIVLKTILWIFFLIVVVFLLILTPPVQNFLRKKVVAYLEKKLETRVEVGRIYIGLPKNVVLENIYLEDRQKDTLFSGGKIKVNIGIWQLITKNEVNINSIALENITAKIKRQLPDTSFNFQFIVDAFAPADSATPNPTDTSNSVITIGSIEFNKIRLIYKDGITGSDMEASLDHLDTRIEKFDPANLAFNIPETNIKGLTAKIYQSKPLAVPEPEAKDRIEAKQPNPLQLTFKEADLKDIKIDYRNDVSATYANLDIGLLNVLSNTIDLNNRIIDLDNISLENTIAAIRIGRKEEAKIVVKEAEQEVKTQAEAGWRISAGTLDLENNSIQFDNDNNPRIKQGMDYGHLKAEALTLQATGIVLGIDSIAGKITKATFKEQSGFVLNELKTDFLYTGHEAYLRDLYLRTPGTELKRNAAIHYVSIDALKNDIGNMHIDLDIQESKLLVKDVLTFAPMLRQQPAFAHPDAVWYINSRITGRVADLNIDALQVQGLQDTKIDVTGNISGLPSMKNLTADLAIKKFSSSRRDINRFIPKNTLPPNIVFPSRLAVSGNIKGNSSQMNTNLSLTTDLGDAVVKGSFSQFDDPNRMGYNAKIETRSLDIGTIIQNKEMLGPVSATITAKGTGFDPKTADATFAGIIHSAIIKGYNYRDVKVNGSIAKQKANLDASVADPNIHFVVNAKADLSQHYPAVQLSGMIDSIKLQPLHFTKDKMIYRGKIEGNFPVTDPNNLEGELFLTQSLFIHNEQRVQLDTIQLLAGRSDSSRYLQLHSDVMTAKLEGQYKVTELGTIFQQAVQPYFAIMPGNSIVASEPYDFTLNAYVLDNPALKVFIPGLDKMDSVSLQTHFSDNNGWTAFLKAPAIDMGPNKIRNLELKAGTNQNAIDITTTIKQITSGTSIELDNTTLVAKIANNKIDFALNNKDKGLKTKYNIKGLFQQPRTGDYQFAISPDSLILNYDAWTISDKNQIVIAKQGINASNFVLRKNGQQLSINSLSTNPNAPMEVNFDQFKLATLTGFVQTDSTLVNGTLNGKLTFKDLSNEFVFAGDLAVNDLSIKGDTVGNVKMLVNNNVADTYAADITLSGRGNDVRLNGNYFLKPGASNFDFDLDIREMPMTTAQAFSNDMIRDATGSLNGKFDVTGTIVRPIVKGDLNFNKAGFNFSMLNSYFTIDQEKIRVNEEGLTFDRFEIKDSAQNSLRIDGLAATTNFTNYTFDLDVRANNFRALNSTKKDNKIFYGQLYFNTNLKIKGTESAPVVDGRLVVNDKTKMTIVLPQREPGIVEREGIVEFVDMDAPLNDSLFMAGYDSLNTSSFTGMDITVNIEIEKDAELSLVIDEGNGDFLNVKGEALLTAGIDPSGKINLAGTYELEQGSYELTFNFIRRKFDIEKGSRIVWEGEPTKATVDLKAIYVANAAPLDLVKNQLEEATAFQRNTYMQKLPFDVYLTMEGQLLKPEISFDIVLPEEKKYAVSGEIITTVRTRLDQLRQEPGEMNKQVFSLLLLNRFMADNPFNSSGGSFNAGVLARQSVSKLLTEQLNRLAEDLVAGVDLKFDVLSSEDYTTGERRDRTDLNVGLSKQLLNDRLTISVGSNFELEGPQNSNQQSSNIAGNVALDYQISRDNRYLLRAYRKNEYQGVIDGQIIETGLGFIITVDYNRFREIFISKRERDQRKLRRQQQKELEEQQKLQKAADSLPVNK
ncbi:MAG: translocation/assembly module TamB domain-containing protein [Chitinophagaceae bacterium]